MCRRSELSHGAPREHAVAGPWFRILLSAERPMLTGFVAFEKGAFFMLLARTFSQLHVFPDFDFVHATRYLIVLFPSKENVQVSYRAGCSSRV